MRTPTPDATVILLVCIACIWCPSGCLSDETDTHDPVAVIATALDVDPARVAIQDSQPRDQGAARRVLAEISDDAGPARKVIAEYEVPGGLVRHLSWPNGRVPRPGQPISIDVALERAHELMDRLFPSVPCEMALLHAEPLGSFVAADGVGPPLMYHFLWQGNAPEGASTGDTVAVFISAVTGEPVAYHQRVASKRPQIAWQRHLAFGAQTAPVADGAAIYLPSGPELHAVDLGTGTDRWGMDLGEAVAGVILANGVVYASLEDGTVCAISPADGDLTARTPPVEFRGEKHASGLEVGRSGTVVASSNGRVNAWSPDLQTLLWTWSPPLPQGYSGPSVLGAPTADGAGRVLVSSSSGSLYALNEEDGTIAWRYGEAPFALPFTAAVDGEGRVFWLTGSAGEYRQALVCLDGQAGTILWSANLPAYSYTDPAVAADKVLVVSADSALSCFAGDSGQLMWRTELPDPRHHPIFDAPVVVGGDGLLYAAVRSAVHCLALADGTVNSHCPVEGSLDIRHLLLPGEGCLIVVHGGGDAHLLRDVQ